MRGDGPGGIRWARAVVRTAAVMGADVLPAVAEVIARAGPAALEIQRTAAGIRWAVLAPEDRLPALLEGLQAASGHRLLPGPSELAGPALSPRGTFFVPVPAIPVLPPVRPAAGGPAPEVGPGAGALGNLMALPPGSGRRIWLWGGHPDASRLLRLAGPAFAGRLPEASAWALWWRIAWGMAMGGSLLLGLALQLLLVFPEALALLPPEGVFLAGAAGVVVGALGISALIRFWEWRHLSPEALREKLRTALLEASLEAWGGPEAGRAALPGVWTWRPARGETRFPLAAHEAAALWLPPPGFPVEQVADPEGRMDMPALGGAWPDPADGLPVGRRAADGRPVRIPWPSLPVVVLGGTGSGKSAFLMNVVEALLAQGEEAPGLLILDPHGPLARWAFRRMARAVRRRPEWAARLVLVDPTWDRAVPLNLFCAPEAIWAINTLLTAGRRIWEGYWGPRMSGVLEAAALILWSYNRQVPEELRLSFRHVPYVLFNVRLRREELMRGLPPADLPQAVLLDLQLGQAAEAARSPLGWQVEVASPIVSKVIALNHPWLRAALAAPRMADMERWIAERRWVIVSLPSGAMGEGNAELIAAWFYNLWEWAFRRAGTERPHPTFILLDEVHRIASGLDLPRTLAEIRKYGGVPFLASQSLSVLSLREDTRELSPALLGNAGTLVVFRPDPTDLPLLERALGWADRAAGERLRADLPAFHFYLRALVDGRWAPPVLVDARGAFPVPAGEEEETGREEEGEIAFLRAMVAAAHPEDYIAVEEGIRHEQVNAMRLLTPDLRAALEQLDLMSLEDAPGRPASVREELGL